MSAHRRKTLLARHGLHNTQLARKAAIATGMACMKHVLDPANDNRDGLGAHEEAACSRQATPTVFKPTALQSVVPAAVQLTLLESEHPDINPCHQIAQTYCQGAANSRHAGPGSARSNGPALHRQRQADWGILCMTAGAGLPIPHSRNPQLHLLKSTRMMVAAGATAKAIFSVLQAAETATPSACPARASRMMRLRKMKKADAVGLRPIIQYIILATAAAEAEAAEVYPQMPTMRRWA